MTKIKRKIEKIIVLTLFGNKMIFNSLNDAINAIKEFPELPEDVKFCRYEIYIRFTNEDKIDGSFKEADEAINFLNIFKPQKVH